MNKGSWGKLRAYFDVQTDEGFTIKGFRIVEGINGLFVSPQVKKEKMRNGMTQYLLHLSSEKN